MGRVLPRRGGVVAVVSVVLTSFLLLGPEARAVTRFRHFDLPEESGPGEITTAGAISEFPLPIGGGPAGITAGPDGNLWFAHPPNRIGRITTAGVLTEFPIPTEKAGPIGITAGPDGNLWFTENAGNKV